MNNKLPSIDHIRSILDYDTETGVFTWKVRRGRAAAGSKAGQVNTRTGYRAITIDRVKYYAHRLAWYLCTSEDPGELEIDHINHNRDDNRLVNLRPVSRIDNCRNYSRIPTHVTPYKGKYMAQLTFQSQNYYLGVYETAEECREVVLKKKQELTLCN